MSGLDLEVLLQMGLAVVLGGAIGFERELRGRPAGLRTLILVCLGSTIIMIVSTQLASQFSTGPGEDVIRVDPGRIAAGIVTGIGFLGGGVVLKLGDIVRGVTTAATIWFVAALGIAIGEGHYGLAVVSTLLGILVLSALHSVEAFFGAALHRILKLRIASDRSDAAVASVREMFMKSHAKLQDIRVAAEIPKGETNLSFYFKIPQKFQAPDLVKKISEIDGVRTVEWD